MNIKGFLNIDPERPSLIGAAVTKDGGFFRKAVLFEQGGGIDQDVFRKRHVGVIDHAAIEKGFADSAERLKDLSDK